MLKSHDHFAVFSKDGHWEGDLTAVRPGEGYMFRRLGSGEVTVKFFNQHRNGIAQQRAPRYSAGHETNMTMIAKVEGEGLRAYIGNELVGVAAPVDSLWFLTISSDIDGELRFETEDGETLLIANYQMPTINYVPDAHHGTLRSPVIMRPGDNRPYKIIENNHVIIIRNNEKYDVTGKKL